MTFALLFCAALLATSDRGLLQISREYYDVAANTGGDIYFWAPGEFATARLQVPVHREGVVLSYGTLETKKLFEIQVESGVEEMTLFAAIQRKDLAVLIRPDGSVARDRDGEERAGAHRLRLRRAGRAPGSRRNVPGQTRRACG
jgi:hypothetical protein